MVPKFAVVGQNVARRDAAGKATGSTKYAVDMKLPRMLAGKVLRCPHPHARILKIDTSRAESLPGVKALITAADVPNPKVFQTSWEPPLATDRVRYIGEAVAGVAAVDEETALEALKLIQVTYEELPAVFDPEAAMMPGAPQIHAAANNTETHFEIVRGDVEKGFHEADVIVSERFVTPRQNQVCMEPDTCLAYFDDSGTLTAWSSTARIFLIRAEIASVMGMPENMVRIIQPHAIGGHFGGRGVPMTNMYYVAALLAKKSGLPVKIFHTSEEDFATGHCRGDAIVEMKMGAKRDGTIVAKETKVIANQGAYGTSVGKAILTVTAMRHENFYRFTNIKTDARLVYTNLVPPGPMRGFGNAEGHFALESLIDMLAEKLGMDPVEFRLKNILHTGETSVHGWIIRSGGLEECIRKASEAIDWKDKRARKHPGDALVATGLGITCAIHVAGLRISGVPWPIDISTSGAFVKVNYDGTVELLSGEGDCGQGASTVLAQICAEELGVRFEDVRVVETDTDTSPFAGGPVSSRVTTISGNAVRRAAADAKRSIFQAAAEKLEVTPEELDSREGRIFVKAHPEKALSFREAVAGVANPPILGEGVFIPHQPGTDPNTFYGDCAAAYSFSAQAAEVGVDTETGEVMVKEYISACDLGQTINPSAAEGQIEGGISQGIGYTLTERYEVSGGEVTSRRFADYKVPTAADLPDVKAILVESNDPCGPFGAKGVGEIVMVPTAPAITNAIYDALGIRMKDLPITPEKVLAALAQKEKNAGNRQQ